MSDVRGEDSCLLEEEGESLFDNGHIDALSNQPDNPGDRPADGTDDSQENSLMYMVTDDARTDTNNST